MRKYIYTIAILVGLVLTCNVLFAQTNFVSGENPIFRNSFTADPAPMVHNGRLYVYVGKDEAKDGEMFTMTAWLCYSTTDMKNWTYHGPIMKPSDFSWGDKDAWAAQVVERNNKFYLYVTVTGKNPYGGRNIGVAVSDSPTGPFVDAKGTPLVRDNMTNNGKVWDDIDPTVLIDDDGQAYMSWGNPICYLAKLKPNMIEIDGVISQITPPNYAEGPWLSKRKGLYYLTYPAFVAPVGSEQICYATATNINGPWTYRGILTGTAKNSYTIHPGIVEYKGQSYLFIHNATLTLNGQGPALGRRSVTVEHLCYNEDGTIKPIAQTTAGITVPSPCPATGEPTVSFISPMSNAVFTELATIEMAVSASDPDGTVSKVEFYNGDTRLGEDASAPYTFTWNNVAKGSYTIKAVATDNEGEKGEVSIVVKVNIPQAPYEGVAHEIPGTIQFEDFDVGGNGSSYFDDSDGSETDVTYRNSEDVDLENCTDVGTGYNVGYATAGEWLEYTVDVLKPGKYDMELRVACSGDARTLSVTMDGVAIAADVAIPNTTGWQVWKTVTVSGIELMSGEKVMRVTLGETDFVNMNYVAFVLTEEYIKEPFNGTAHMIPGRIEAQEYDKGGEGLSYHEANTNGNQGGATLRNDEVDIEATQDTDGDYNLGYTLTGEWLEYTVDILQDGKYNVDLRLAKDGNGGLMHIEIEGENITGAISVPNTRGWQTWHTVTLNDISLTAGEHIMRITFDSDYINLNYVEFKGLVTGNTNTQKSELMVYPNPFTSKGIQISKSAHYQLTDLSGLILESGEVLESQWVGKNLPCGVYLLRVDQNVFKIIKK